MFDLLPIDGLPVLFSLMILITVLRVAFNRVSMLIYVVLLLDFLSKLNLIQALIILGKN